MKMKQPSESQFQTAPFALMFQGFDAQALAVMQQRGFEALQKTAEIVTETMTATLQKHMELYAMLGERGAATRKGSEGLDSKVEIDAARAKFERVLKSVRDMSDDARSCCYKVYDEFAACTRDNLDSFKSEELAKESSAPAVQVPLRVAARS